MIPILYSIKTYENILKLTTDNKNILDNNEQLYSVSVQDSRQLLEYLVKSAMYEWVVYNVSPSTENYMSSVEQKECINYIIQKIMENLTPAMEYQISIGYPFDTEEQKIKTIMNSAKLNVLDYSIKQNTNSNNSKIPNINLM